MSLELAAMRWLWIEQKCHVVLEQRNPIYGIGTPDVIGVTYGRYLTEIEIKRSLSDFKKDFEKPHRFYQSVEQIRVRQLYYLVPESLTQKVKEIVPKWAGLMETTSNPEIVSVVKNAPVNKNAVQLGIHECARLARQMTSHMMGYALENGSIKQQWMHGENFDYVDWVEAGNGTYQI